MAVGFPTKANWAAGDILTAAQMDDLAGTVNTLANVPPRNAILNSAFNVWQRGTSFSLAASTTYLNGFTADRWVTQTGANQAVTISRQATNDTTNLPNIQYCMRYQRNSGQTGTSTLTTIQNIETVNSIPFAGKSVTLSFYARAGANYSATSSALGVILATGTGTDQNAFVGITGVATPISSTATLTTTWQRFTFTGTVAASATQIFPEFTFNPTGTAGTNDYFEITGVQLELGSTASTYYPNGNTYQAELAACQRYYWRAGGDQTTQPYGNGFGTAATTASILVYNPVPMRTAPTLTDYLSLWVVDHTTTTVVSSLAISTNWSGKNCVALTATVASGLTVNRPYNLIAQGTTSSYIGLSAEL